MHTGNWSTPIWIVGDSDLVKSIIKTYERLEPDEKRRVDLFRGRPIFWIRYQSDKVNLALLNDSVAQLSSREELQTPGHVICVAGSETMRMLRSDHRVGVAETVVAWMATLQSVIKESVGQEAFETIKFLWSSILPQPDYSYLLNPNHGQGMRRKLNLAVTLRLTRAFKNVITVENRNVNLRPGFAKDNKGVDFALSKVILNWCEAVRINSRSGDARIAIHHK